MRVSLALHPPERPTPLVISLIGHASQHSLPRQRGERKYTTPQPCRPAVAAAAAQQAATGACSRSTCCCIAVASCLFCARDLSSRYNTPRSLTLCAIVRSYDMLGLLHTTVRLRQQTSKPAAVMRLRLGRRMVNLYL